MQELKAGKVPVCIRKDYTMYLEFFKGHLWFHIDIRKWSSSVKKDCDKDFSSIADLVGVAVLALIREEDIKLKRFAKCFGWTEKCQINLIDGSRAYIYASKA